MPSDTTGSGAASTAANDVATGSGEPEQQDLLELAEQVGRAVTHAKTDEDRNAAEKMARLLASEASAIVRETLASELRTCSLLASDIAERIARDIDRISTPFLLVTEAISDTALVEIVKTCEQYAIAAIAQRKSISEPLAFAVVEHGDDVAANHLIANPGAELSERVGSTLIGRFQDQQDLVDALSDREDLPLVIAERLISLVSDACRARMMKYYGLSPDQAHFVSSESEWKAVFATMEKAGERQLSAYVHKLVEEDKLDSNLLFLMAKSGQMRLFSFALSQLSGASHTRIESAVRGGDHAILERQLLKAEVAKAMIPEFLSALSKALIDA